MGDTPVTQNQLKDFKEHLDMRFDELHKSLAPIVDPVNGVFIRISKNEDAVGKAHERLDSINDKACLNLNILKGDNGNPGVVDKIREFEKFRATMLRVFWILITPLLGGIGYTIYEFIKNH